MPRRSEWFLKRSYWELGKNWSCCAGRWNFGRRPGWLWEHLLDETRCKKGAYKRWTQVIALISWKNWQCDCETAIYCLWQLGWLWKSPMAVKGLTLHLSLKRWERKLGNYLLISSISVTRRSGSVSLLGYTSKAIKDKKVFGNSYYGLLMANWSAL